MTLILEFEHKLIFYKPGILRYAMLRARTQLRATRGCAERHLLLSRSLKHGWAEAKAHMAGLEQLRGAAPAGRDERSQALHDARQVGGSGHDARLIRDRMEFVAIAPPQPAASAALARRQLH